jgi:hypothetical protein
MRTQSKDWTSCKDCIHLEFCIDLNFEDGHAPVGDEREIVRQRMIDGTTCVYYYTVAEKVIERITGETIWPMTSKGRPHRDFTIYPGGTK